MLQDSHNNEQLLQWWRAAREGDVHAFKALHHHLFEGLYAYALKLLDDETLSNEAVQDLFVKLWVKKKSLHSIQQVKPYFYAALRKQILNYFRDLKLKNIKIQFFQQPNIEFSPEEIIVKKESDFILQQKISILLNQLPKRQKEVIYLRYFENMDNQQIAEIMGINYQSVSNLTQKALHKLRDAKMLSTLISLSFLFQFVKN
ncbi:MAG: sigma-70 family RNA polymerase sigma factor [Hydrotalea flava]|uniref:RNA polymerase sigma factor n=1 Tax=Hydrotalea TaxID=1004300 RepID=UPI0009446910|nr:MULTISPECIES: sigma-70 family RNA polymerase sigma factor [Hydrotalea]MBY0348683.1 sigma-70 family RNA polymerase sigma factor [Hydrotalea flava]NIM35632.1 sigma-70 family RNA polymerase sigma factor [Hydrotalea flava]NIM38491.1 sigma-70 family RNA polymerase sigma factor [Hydrotalea flava]NIN03643.1 sigma-70 family RNA polymerase sigma factor [Hydrotalea flava]NIN15348.1 sigma-70 family RNA polymerase sigma factor [Hydrotalea flava]